MSYLTANIKAVSISSILSTTEKQAIFAYIEKQIQKRDQGVTRFFISLSKLHSELDNTLPSFTNEKIQEGFDSYFSFQQAQGKKMIKITLLEPGPSKRTKAFFVIPTSYISLDVTCSPKTVPAISRKNG